MKRKLIEFSFKSKRDRTHTLVVFNVSFNVLFIKHIHIYIAPDQRNKYMCSFFITEYEHANNNLPELTGSNNYLFLNN